MQRTYIFYPCTQKQQYHKERTHKNYRNRCSWGSYCLFTIKTTRILLGSWIPAMRCCSSCWCRYHGIGLVLLWPNVWCLWISCGLVSVVGCHAGRVHSTYSIFKSLFAVEDRHAKWSRKKRFTKILLWPGLHDNHRWLTLIFSDT